MENILRSELFLLTFTIGVYVLGLFLYRKTKINILHPIITSMLVIVLFLCVTDISYGEFKHATKIIDFMLGPSVVALGYLLYRHIEHVRRNLLSIITSIIIGSIVSMISVVFIAKWIGASDSVARSLAPKSVTTPIAIEVSRQIGGIESLTAIVVVLVGIFGSMVAPYVFNIFGIKNPVAKGLALGASAHGIGTARAIEMGAVEGAISGLAIGLMGVITALLVPIIEFFI